MNTLIAIVLILTLPLRLVLAVAVNVLYASSRNEWRYRRLLNRQAALRRRYEDLKCAAESASLQLAAPILAELKRLRDQRAQNEWALDAYEDAIRVGVVCESCKAHLSLRNRYDLDIAELEARLENVVPEELSRIEGELAKIADEMRPLERFSCS